MTTIHPPTQPAAATSTTRRVRRAPWRSANGRIWILQTVLAVGYAMTAAPKLSGDPRIVAQLADLGVGATGVHVIGALELAGAVGLLIARLCGLAALAFVALMAGAVALTVANLGVSEAIVPAAFGAVAAVIAWKRRGRTARLAALVLPRRR